MLLPPPPKFRRLGFSEEVATSSAERFLLILLAFLGARRTFSSTRARFPRFLLALACLLGALSPFAQAQAQTTVWSATLTPKALAGDFLGCNTGATTLCTDFLDDDDFTYNGVNYTVKALTSDSSGIFLALDKAVPQALKAALTLRIGSSSFALSGATVTGSFVTGDTLGWSSGPTLTADQDVSVSLTAPGTTTPPPPPPPPLPPPLSTNASLRDIELSHGEIEFSPSSLSYQVAVGYGPQNITLTPQTSHFRASLRINGEHAARGEGVEIPLNQEEPTIIKIEVTAENARVKKVYTITVTRCGTDRWALERLYEATGGEDWHENHNWNSKEPPEQWFGVITDEDGGVISLRLEGNGLSGEISRDLQCLSQIKELALWDNDGLSGEVPEEIALSVERAVLRDVAVALSLNPGWFDTYEDPFGFGSWHGGVTMDEDGRVTELDFTGEGIEGEIPGSVFELRRLGKIETGCGVTLEVEAPEGVSVSDGCGGGCALGSGDSSVFGLFLVTLLVFAVLGRKRALG